MEPKMHTIRTTPGQYQVEIPQQLGPLQKLLQEADVNGKINWDLTEENFPPQALKPGRYWVHLLDIIKRDEMKTPKELGEMIRQRQFVPGDFSTLLLTLAQNSTIEGPIMALGSKGHFYNKVFSAYVLGGPKEKGRDASIFDLGYRAETCTGMYMYFAIEGPVTP